MGTLSLVAHATGAGRDDRAAAAVAHGIWIALALASLPVAAGAALAETLVSPVCPRAPGGGPDPAVLREGALYLRIVFLGAPLAHLAGVVDAAFKGRGDTLTPLVLEALALAVNLATMATLTLGLLGAPAMGVAGVAIGRLAGRGVVVLGGGALILSGRLGFRLRAAAFRPERALFAQLLGVGVPQGFAMFVYSAAMTIVYRMVGVLGPAATAALGIGIRQIEFLAFTTYLGFHAASATVVGQNLGAGDGPRARAGARAAFLCSGSLGALATALFVSVPGPLAALLGPADPVIVGHVAEYVRVIGLSQLVLSLQVVATGVFVGAGRTTVTLASSLLFLSVRVGLVWALLETGLGFSAVCWGMTATTVLQGATLTAAVATGFWVPRELREGRRAPAGTVPAPLGVTARPS